MRWDKHHCSCHLWWKYSISETYHLNFGGGGKGGWYPLIPPHDTLFNNLACSGMIPETGEEMAGVVLPALGARWSYDRSLIRRIKQCLVSELHRLCVAFFLSEDVISSMIKRSIWYNAVAQFLMRHRRGSACCGPLASGVGFQVAEVWTLTYPQINNPLW